MFYKRIILTLIIASCAAGFTCYGQERSMVRGLEADSVYMALVGQEVSLKHREDSLSAAVTHTRGLFRTDPDNRQVYSDDIIRLEAEIFDTRNLIGIVAGKINAIEQEYIIKNLSGGSTSQGRDNPGNGSGAYPETSRVLVLNPFFANNLQPDDYAMLLEAQKKEEDVAEKISIFAGNYARIKLIIEAGETADSPAVADSLYRLWETMSGLNERISESVATDFGYVYDNKLFCYNYILDKLGRRNQLATFEKKTAETREQALNVADGAQSAAIAAYPYRKALLFEYEQALARLAGYTASEDSIRRAQMALKAVSFDFPAVEMEEKLFLDFAGIGFHNPPKYNTRNPVPDLIVHPKGEIYRILLGSFQKAQPVSLLKGAYPVGVLKDEGRFAYYAGGYATLAEAVKAVEELRKKGFRDPKVGHWINGRLTVLTQTQIDRALGTSQTGLFRLSIDTGGKPLPEVVREIIEDFDPGAEISRSGSLFIVGTFSSRDEAEELAEEIEDNSPQTEVKIETVG